MASIGVNTIPPTFTRKPLQDLPRSAPLQCIDGFTQVPNEAISLLHYRPYNGQLGVEHLSVRLKLDQLRACVAHGTAVNIQANPQTQASFIIPLHIKAVLYCSKKIFSICGNQDIMYLPPGPWELCIDSPSLSILIILVEIKVIQDLMTSCFDLNQSNRSFDNEIDEPIPLGEETRLGRSLADFLHASLRLIESDLSQGCNEMAESDIGNLLLRQLLFQWSDKLKWSRKVEPRVLDFEELVDWMRQHCCDSTICLSELESISGYTGRNLQRVFQRRFGCGPMQYLRKERLMLAYKKLESALPGTSVTDIVERCGYRNASSFYRDFKEAYKVTPATVRGRLWQTSR
jgi:AraC-like DNA-binding protein